MQALFENQSEARASGQVTHRKSFGSSAGGSIRPRAIRAGVEAPSHILAQRKLDFADQCCRSVRSLLQRWLLQEAISERVGVTDEKREVIGAPLPPERKRSC